MFVICIQPHVGLSENRIVCVVDQHYLIGIWQGEIRQVQKTLRPSYILFDIGLKSTGYSMVTAFQFLVTHSRSAKRHLFRIKVQRLARKCQDADHWHQQRMCPYAIWPSSQTHRHTRPSMSSITQRYSKRGTSLIELKL